MIFVPLAIFVAVGMLFMVAGIPHFFFVTLVGVGMGVLAAVIGLVVKLVSRRRLRRHHWRTHGERPSHITTE